MGSMETLWTELGRLRSRQDEDFELMIGGFSVQRDILRLHEDLIQQLHDLIQQQQVASQELQRALQLIQRVQEEQQRILQQQQDLLQELMGRQEEQERAFAAYRGSTGEVFKLLETLIRQTQEESDTRLDRLEERMDSLERRPPPAA